MTPIKVIYVSEWQWLIKSGNNKTTLRVGMTYGNNGNPSTYQFHLQDPKNISGIACCGFIQEFGFPSEWAAKDAGIAQYNKTFNQ